MLILVLLSSVVVRDSKKREIQLFRKLMVNFFSTSLAYFKGGKKRARKTAESNLHSKWFATLLQLTHLLSLLLFVLP